MLHDFNGTTIAALVRASCSIHHTLVDIGCTGKYRWLLPEFQMDGVAESQQKTCDLRLSAYYRRIFVTAPFLFKSAGSYGGAIISDFNRMGDQVAHATVAFTCKASDRVFVPVEDVDEEKMTELHPKLELWGVSGTQAVYIKKGQQ